MAQKKGKSTGTGSGATLHKRGDGLGTGPVGNGPRGNSSTGTSGRTGASGSSRPNGASQRPSGSTQRPGNGNADERGILSDLLTGGSSSSSGSSSGSSSSSGGRFNLKSLIPIIIVVAIVAFVGPRLLSCLGSGSSQQAGQQSSNISNVISGLLGGSGGVGSLLGSALGNTAGNVVSSAVNSWLGTNNTGKLNTDVSSEARLKRTNILGNNKDTVTIMVYMCGTDLESKYGMASSDLSEMAAAKFGENVNLIVYTGGCKQWKTSGISNTNNMILQVTDGKVKVLNSNAGNAAMTNPKTLSSFIQYCAANFPANRNELILWDHGGGSVTGYGYDEKNATIGSMNLSGINTALKDGGVKFDFVGFDACLMATAETALMLDDHADYMIASEESEPGIGWYYTDWLTELGSNTSMDTVVIGKNICDDFVTACSQKCAGQSTTLSVVDLAEFSETVPDKLAAFAKATTKQITGKDYSTVATARSSTREFAESSAIDQIDLVHFALNLGTDSANKLKDAVLSAVKYNRTSSDMTNSYGVSIYFPYSSTRHVDSAIKTYNAIGMDDAYSKCIKEFATMEVAGQAASGGTANYQSSIFNLLGGATNQSTETSSGALTSLLSGVLGSSSTQSSSGLGNIASLISGLGSGNLDFLTGRSLTNEEVAEYLSENMIDPSNLNWKEAGDMQYIALTADEWKLVNDLQMSMYYDDGEGFIDLGTDVVYSFDKDYNLLAPDTAEWITVNGQLVSYNFDSMTSEDGKSYEVLGHIPALLDGERVELIVVFSDQEPNGYIAGARPVYDDETEVVAKNLEPLKAGQTIDFIADYYNKNGTYEDTYMIGDQMTVTDEMKIDKTPIADGYANIMYRFTDIYGKIYWSEAMQY